MKRLTTGLLIVLAAWGCAAPEDSPARRPGSDAPQRTAPSRETRQPQPAQSPERADETREGFPRYGILPKRETGADRFLAQHPEYDGRGVVVAIFDTGIDPGAPGLQTTSDGKPKIVNLVDGSGSGDVDTSTVAKLEDGTLAGLTGRRLTPGTAWNNPTGEYHLGIKRAYELFPGGLVGRLTAKRREKWDERQRTAVTAAQRELDAWNAANPKPTPEQRKQRDDLKERLAQLAALQEKYDDPGPIYDCVVFHDGQVWRAVIDTDEDGDLGHEKLLTNYRLEREYATFGDEDLLNFAVNIYDDGNLLSIVSDAGAHGTHVAGIVAAHFPDQSELNGIAPGAQLVGVKIGDSRLGSTSVGTGEVRGLVAVLQNECDLINMSYGGPTSDPNGGRLAALYSEIVNKHNVIFVASAGNSGPALSTVGAPGGTTSAILGTGAYVSPEMMAAEYSLRETLPEMQFTWSSRGPTYDGDLGVKFCAPGAAIAPVPNWSLQRNMLMNGTSMASPNACGGVALLLSGLKAAGIAHTPHRVRRALENTARVLPNTEVFAQGRGLIQIDRAFEYLTDFREYPDQDLRFEVTLPQRGGDRGVYLREPHETDRLLETDVNVDAVFHEDADNRAKVAFELRLSLESTAPWVQVPEHLMLMHGGRSFGVRVDPTALPPGVHYAEVRGYDASAPQRGPLFRLPVTVIRAERLPSGDPYRWRTSLRFDPGQIERRFVVVPEGATWADMTVRALDQKAQRRVVVHVVQTLPKRPFSKTQLKQRIWMEPDSEEVISFPVVGGRTLEVCLAQYWSSLGEGAFDFELEFHGIVPDEQSLHVDGSDIFARVDVSTPLRRERLSPTVELNTLRKAIRPDKAEVRALSGVRDALPEGRQISALTLTYSFELDEDAKITPRVAIMNDEEFAESWESMMWTIFDASKRWIASGTTDPGSVSLKKGKYTIRFHLRHDRPDRLEDLKGMALLVDQVLDKPVALSVYADPDDALAGGAKFGGRTLETGDRAALYVASPDPEMLPKAAKPGDTLLGTISFGQSDAELPGSGKRPGGYAATLLVAPKPNKDKDEPDDKDEPPTLADEVRDLKVARLAKLHDEKDSAEFDALAAEILEQHPGHLPVFVERLKRVDGDDRDEHLQEVIDAADELIQQIDTAELASNYGVKLDPDDKQAGKLRKKMDERKDALADALYRKGRALSYMSNEAGKHGADAPADAYGRFGDEATLDAEFERNFAELARWVDTTDKKYVRLHIARERRHGRLGEALKRLNEHIEESEPSKMLFEKRADLLKDLGWAHWKDYEEKWLLIRFPAAYPPF